MSNFATVCRPVVVKSYAIKNSSKGNQGKKKKKERPPGLNWKAKCGREGGGNGGSRLDDCLKIVFGIRDGDQI